MEFHIKTDVDNFLRNQDITRGIPYVCKKVVDTISKHNPSLFDEICDKIESGNSYTSRHGSGFFTTLAIKGFTEIGYDASRVPKSYAFVCILKQMLPEK